MGQPATLRLQNRSSILSLLFQHHELTRTQIAQLVGVSTVTVNSIVRGLLEQGLAESKDALPGQPGRPAQLISLSHRAGTVIGVDVQRHQVFLAFSGLRQGPAHTLTVQVVTADLTEQVVRLLDDHRRLEPHGPVKGVTIALPAPVGPDGRPGEPNTLPELDLARLNSWATAHQVSLAYGNDANLAAAAEYQLGNVRTTSSFGLLLERESGLGCGLFLGGQLYLGRTGRAGELGMTVWRGQEPQEVPGPTALEQLGEQTRYRRMAEILAALVTVLDLETLLLSTLQNDRLRAELSVLLPASIRVVESQHGDHGPALGALNVTAGRVQTRLLSLQPAVPEAM